MYLRDFKIQNFRNYDGEIELHFNGANHIFIGDNAQGKTNLLEAIYYLALAQSFRTSKDMDLVNFQRDFFKVGGRIISGEDEFTINYFYSKKNRKKEAFINSLKCKSISQTIGKLTVVVFSPEHLLLVKGSPSLRRKYIDTQIAQIKPKYYYYLRRYRNILSQRNALLKEKGFSTKDLLIWDEQLCSYGAVITGMRLKALSNIKVMVQNIFQDISGKEIFLQVGYKSTLGKINHGESIKSILNLFLDKLISKRQYEMAIGATTVGPHRDDILLYLDQKPLKEFGSQGQQRLAVLSLKLAEMNFIYENTGQYPVLLMDDVMSELDTEKRRLLLDNLNRAQTFITATEKEYFEANFLEKASLWTIDNGKISRE